MHKWTLKIIRCIEATDLAQFDFKIVGVRFTIWNLLYITLYLFTCYGNRDNVCLKWYVAQGEASAVHMFCQLPACVNAVNERWRATHLLYDFLQEINVCKHGRKSPGDESPRICSGGRLYRLSPQIFVVFQNFKRSPWIRPPRFQPRFTPLRVSLQVLVTCEIWRQARSQKFQRRELRAGILKMLHS
jgi:hypothetical protein